jgi:hypothetical protein
MPISIVKATEILDLNVKEAGPKMPPDVKESLLLAIDAFSAIVAHRLSSTLPTILLLDHEAPSARSRIPPGAQTEPGQELLQPQQSSP